MKLNKIICIIILLTCMCANTYPVNINGSKYDNIPKPGMANWPIKDQYGNHLAGATLFRNDSKIEGILSSDSDSSKCIAIYITDLSIFKVQISFVEFRIPEWVEYNNSTIKCCGCRSTWNTVHSAIVSHENGHLSVMQKWNQDNSTKGYYYDTGKNLKVEKRSTESYSDAKSKAKQEFKRKADALINEIRNNHIEKQEEFHKNNGSTVSFPAFANCACTGWDHIDGCNGNCLQ